MIKQRGSESKGSIVTLCICSIMMQFLICIAMSSTIHAYQRWNFSSDEEGWTGRNGTYVDQTADNGGQLTVSTVGSDPGIVSPDLSLSASSNNLLKMRVATFCTDRNATVYFKRSGSNTVYTGESTYYSSGGSWGEYDVDLSGNANWHGTITQLRIDPAGSCGSSTSPGFLAFDWIELSQRPNTPPIVSISMKNSEMSTGWDNEVTVASHDPEEDSYSCQYKVGSSGSWYAADDNGSTEIPASRFNLGTNTVYVRCTDIFNLYGEKYEDVTNYAVPESSPGSLSPANGIQLSPESSYSFTFAAVSYADHYQVQIDNNSDFSSPLYNEERAGSPFSVSNSALQPGDRYYWRICGENVLGSQGPWSSTWFDIEEENSPPSIIVFNPHDAQNDTVTEISNGWNVVVAIEVSDPDGDSVNCEYQVNDSSWKTTSTTDGDFTIVANEFTPGSTKSGYSNTVRARCTDSNGASDLSSDATITVYPVPNTPPGNLSPDGNDLESAEEYSFIFSGVNLAEHYQWYVSENDDLRDARSKWTAGSPVSDLELTEGKTYYWRVCAENKLGTQGANGSSCSAIANFNIISNNNNAPTPLKPITGDTLIPLPNGEVGLRWTEVSGAFGYKLTIDSTLEIEISAGQTVYNAAGLDPNYEHNWKVCTLNTSSDCVAESSLETFSINNSDPGFVARTENNPDVYWIKFGHKRVIADQTTFFGLGYSDTEIQWFENGSFDDLVSGDSILSNQGFCYRAVDDSTVYLLESGESHPFFNLEGFYAQGFIDEDVYWAKSEGVSWIQQSYPVVEAPTIRVEPKSLNFN